MNPFENTPPITQFDCFKFISGEEKLVKGTTCDGWNIYENYEKLPGFLKAIFDDLKNITFAEWKYESDPRRIHNRFNHFLCLPPDAMKNIVAYIGPYDMALAETCQKFLKMIPRPRLNKWMAAARLGDEELLKKFTPNPSQIKTICESAAIGSRESEEARLNIIERFYQAGTYKIQPKLLQLAAANGDLKILKWAHKCTCGFFWKSTLPYEAIYEAAKNGHLPILIWAEEEGLKLDASLFNGAVLGGELESVKWLHNKGIRGELQYFAALKGHLHIMEWGYKNGYAILNLQIYKHAIQLGRMDMILWAFARNTPLPTNISIIAAQYGFLEMVKFSYNPSCMNEICATAAENGYQSILRWAKENGAVFKEREGFSLPYTANVPS